MYEWICAIQKLIDFIEDNAANNPSLEEISRYLGYSRFYCSVQFHHIAGMKIRDYIAKRRLYMATLAVRDTNKRIIDIAHEYGYSEQSVLTRAFKDAYITLSSFSYISIYCVICHNIFLPQVFK